MVERIDPPEPGVYPDVPMEEYHKWDAASNSQLTRLAKSPAHLKAYLDGYEKKSNALRLGRLIHKAILEPEDFHKNYNVLGDCEDTYNSGDPCTNPAKRITPRGQFCGMHSDEEDALEGVHVVSSDKMETVMGMKNSINRKKSARKFLRGEGKSEYTLVWRDPEIGVMCKARMDRYSPAVPGGAISDLKTTRDASPRAFRRTIWKYKYYLQGMLYLRGADALGLDLSKFVIVACEKDPPYCVMTYILNKDVIKETTERELYDLLYSYKACKENNKWPGYPDKPFKIGLPKWAYDKIEEDSNRRAKQLEEVERS